MVFALSIVDTLFSMVRIWNYDGELFDRRCNSGNEAVNDPSEMDSACLEHQNERRKIQNSLCFMSEQVDKMIDWLGNDEITAIGIYGMGGIGKTTLAEQLYVRLLDHFTFTDTLAYVSVGMDFTVYQLQKNIATAVGLDLDSDKDEIRRSGMLNAFLSRNKKCLLILDDLWGDFRREDVGIPTKCKLVVISRLRHICRILRCQKFIKIEPLSKEESWKLFHHNAGYCALDPTEVPHFSTLVYHKCAGLPLAIAVLADILKGEIDACRWREVFEREDLFSVGEKTHSDDIFSQLKKSYDKLNSTKVKRCFLYAALYPKDWAIEKEELIRMWIGEGIIDDVQSLQVQYDMGHCILNKLFNSCLLETSQDKRGVKMHDFIRRMALSIVGEDLMVGENITPSRSDFCKNVKGISPISSISIISWSTHVKFTNLSILLLQHNSLEEIPESFFKQMCSLRVLSLSHTWITKLPDSVSELEELQVLDLNTCKRLKTLPLLEKLHKLKFLNLSQTAVEQVHCSIVKLKGLMELNLSYIPELKNIPGRVLPALPKLKKLSCLVSGIVNQEVQTLESLEILDAKFENLCELSNYVKSEHWRSLKCFHLQVGTAINPKRPHTRGVSLQGCSLRGHREEHLVLPYDIQELYLEDCSGFSTLSEINTYGFKQEAEVFASLEICTISRCQEVENIFELRWMHNFQSLELLEVKECAQLKELISGCCEVKKAVFDFPQLKQLILNSLPQLKSIWECRLVCASLQSLTVTDCPSLKHLPLRLKDIERLVPLTLECIEGQEEWWDLLEWDESRSKDLLQPFFRCRSSLIECSLKNGHFPDDT